jgi:EAL domain-containing protein (putative c-di-GMP-specific phosphodiesterase class I)
MAAAKLKNDDREAGSLRSRPYARLRPGGTTRRYEIVDAGTESVEQDLARAARLIGLLKRRGARNTPSPASFTLPLCTASLGSAEFLNRLTPMLQESHLGEDTLGFSAPVAAWQRNITATELFIAQCEPLHCFVALDDFDLARGGFGLLRYSALRCLKLDPALTTMAPENRFAHASVAATVKAARVLGLYCVAKDVQTASLARWLASAGVEFADRTSRAGKAGSTTRRARALVRASGA